MAKRLLAFSMKILPVDFVSTGSISSQKGRGE
jgi:hypothetical protein